MTFYPTIDEVCAIQKTLIDRFGGSHGIRDRGALKSALARPQTGYYKDLIEEAAALWESLSQNHPFLDGNKRVAVTVSMAFLMMNGYRLSFNDAETFAFLDNLYEMGRMNFRELDTWLRRDVTS